MQAGRMKGGSPSGLPRVRSGAGNESRTRDLNLGKVALYQLSYSRKSAAIIARPCSTRNARAAAAGCETSRGSFPLRATKARRRSRACQERRRLRGTWPASPLSHLRERGVLFRLRYISAARPGGATPASGNTASSRSSAPRPGRSAPCRWAARRSRRTAGRGTAAPGSRSSARWS